MDPRNVITWPKVQCFIVSSGWCADNVGYHFYGYCKVVVMGSCSNYGDGFVVVVVKLHCLISLC
jgi:hypothetical protein